MIQKQSESRACLTCDSPIKGRSDKKFCDDSCRNTYYNYVKSPNNNLVRNINNALSKNRRILGTFLNEKKSKAKTTKEKLLELGFQFKYFTHTQTSRTGKVYYYCYDRGYLPLENDGYLLVK